MKADNAIAVRGSIQEKAGNRKISLADAIMEIDVLVLVDSSASMEQVTSGGSKHQVAARELADIQRQYPGKVGVISWSSDYGDGDGIVFCPSGVPVQINRNTDMAAVLRYVSDADGVVRIILISDGVPNSEEDALTVARTYKHGIDTVFIGDESDPGAAFLRKLSSLTKGKYGGARDVMQLAPGIKLLMDGR